MERPLKIYFYHLFLLYYIIYNYEIIIIGKYIWLPMLNLHYKIKKTDRYTTRKGEVDRNVYFSIK
jgi:hypothetical protein